jgi:hypothetical protein
VMAVLNTSTFNGFSGVIPVVYPLSATVDFNNEFSSSVFTPISNGTYLINIGAYVGWVRPTTTSFSGQIEFLLQKNSQLLFSKKFNIQPGQYPSVETSFYVSLTSSDSVTFLVSSGSGDATIYSSNISFWQTVSTFTSTSYPALTIIKVA